MYRVIIWGTGHCYNRFFNMVRLQELTGTVKVVAVISNDGDIKDHIDSYTYVRKEEAASQEFDYCLVAIDDFQSVITEADSLGIPRQKLIPLRVLAIPYFDFDKYIAIKESNLTIFSCNCWGGSCYHYLGLAFLSPTINMFFEPSEYIKFLAGLDEYLSLPLQFVETRYETNLKRDYPVGQLGDIRLYFNHYVDFEHAKECWERRKKRIHMENVLCVGYTESKEDVLAFDQLPYRNKVIFIPQDLAVSDTASSCRVFYQDCHDGVNFGMTVNKTANGTKSLLNMFKLLNHEEGFVRV